MRFIELTVSQVARTIVFEQEERYTTIAQVITRPFGMTNYSSRTAIAVSPSIFSFVKKLYMLGRMYLHVHPSNRAFTIDDQLEKKIGANIGRVWYFIPGYLLRIEDIEEFLPQAEEGNKQMRKLRGVMTPSKKSGYTNIVVLDYGDQYTPRREAIYKYAQFQPLI
jgi:hypothetical protein